MNNPVPLDLAEEVRDVAEALPRVATIRVRRALVAALIDSIGMAMMTAAADAVREHNAERTRIIPDAGNQPSLRIEMAEPEPLASEPTGAPSGFDPPNRAN